MIYETPIVWVVADHGVDIYKDGKLVGTIPPSSFLLLISDLALSLERSSTAGRAGLLSAAAPTVSE